MNVHSKIRGHLNQKGHERKWFTTGMLIRIFGESGMRISGLARINMDDI